MTSGNEGKTNATGVEKQDEGQTVPVVKGDTDQQVPSASARGATTVVAAVGYEPTPFRMRVTTPSVVFFHKPIRQALNARSATPAGH
ncbi:unnamed protein product [Dibothriocephalus latus]|uniref:Uncharacterized protein n=1 Tax=Dibothriocephalus latus TaxID=60516 RepID=A0A3P7M4M8_DIBLA|nr:unnamed protein product [Dibothriocephalus latus]